MDKFISKSLLGADFLFIVDHSADGHDLMPRTCDHAPPSRKQHFVDVSKLRILRWGYYTGLSKWVQTNHVSPQIGEPFLAVGRGRGDYGRMVER